MFKNLHPITLFSYYFYTIFISIFSFNPVILILGFSGAFLYLLYTDNSVRLLKSTLIYLLIFILITFTNPLFSHNGKTILFFINDNRITLESLIYGAVIALAVIEIVFLFKCFNFIFDSERIIFLFGKISPKISLVISMTLRFIPNFIKVFKTINTTQKLISEEKRVKRYLNSFSAVVTQSFENSIITSDSMKARGYGLKGRTFYSRFIFTYADFVFILVFTLLFVLTLIGKSDFVYYPSFLVPDFCFKNILGYISFAVLSLIPFIYELKEGIKWKFSISKI